jgi:hypothetical protein
MHQFKGFQINGGKEHMAYRTLAWVMALICGLAIPAGAGTLGSGFFDEPIFQPGAYEKLVNLRAKTRGEVGRNIAVNTAVQNSGIQASTPAHSKSGSIFSVEYALLGQPEDDGERLHESLE